MELRHAVIDGCLSKLRPVLMTSITTALGLLPLIMASSTGSEVQRPLAIVVVGGLLSSTILTLIVIPTLYEWINLKNEMATIDTDVENLLTYANKNSK